MMIESTRFGTFEVGDNAVLTFPDGVPGLPGEHYVLVARDENSPFYWLHSVEHADVALPVTNPWLFFPEYDVRVPDEDARRVALDAPEHAQILCVVRASDRLEDFTVNLAGPIVVNTTGKLGRQILNDTGGYSVRHPLFSEVELNEARAAAQSTVVEAAAV
jgi:flagellar assembly factor FliW